MKFTYNILWIGFMSLVLKAESRNTFKMLQSLLRVVEGRDAFTGGAKLSYERKNTGESPIYYIQMPPIPYYYTHHKPVSNNNRFGQVPVSFHTNGKPSKVYHWRNNKYKKSETVTAVATTTAIPSIITTTTQQPLRETTISTSKQQSSSIPRQQTTNKPTEITTHTIGLRIKDKLKNKIKIQNIKYKEHYKHKKDKILKTNRMEDKSYHPSPIYRIKQSHVKQPSPRLWTGRSNYNGKTSGLYLWESKAKTKQSYKEPIYIKLKQ